LIGAFDDFGFKARQDSGERATKNRPLIGAVGKELFEKWELTEQRRQQRDSAIAILNTCGMNNSVQQQAHRVYENMALLALDLLARIIAMWIDAGPPFSALFTL